MMFEWTLEKLDEVVRLHEASGMSCSQIAALWGVSKGSISGAIRRARGRKVRGESGRAPTLWTADMEQRFRDLHSEGVPYAIIGQEFGITENAARKKAARLRLGYRLNVSNMRGKFGVFAVGRRTPPKVVSSVLAPNTIPVPLTERTGCCYPTTDYSPHLFCNGSLYAGDYCEFHYQLMYKRRAA